MHSELIFGILIGALSGLGMAVYTIWRIIGVILSSPSKTAGKYRMMLRDMLSESERDDNLA